MAEPSTDKVIRIIGQAGELYHHLVVVMKPTTRGGAR